MDVHTHIPLKNYTTMKLGGPARLMADVHTADELIQTIHSAQDRSLAIFILGGGSNTIVHDEGFDGLVIRNRIMGFTVLEETDTTTTVEIGAGEDWDSIVQRTVDMRLQGIEAMSAIPGTAGASPVQNVGAYGQEIADTLVSLQAYDMKNRRSVLLSNEDCQFSYRSSIFRESAKNRYAITSITLKLYKSAPAPPFYGAVQQYFDEHHMTQVNVADIRDAVIQIRANKLPDPTVKPNAGSFFKNAIIDDWQFQELLARYPDMPHYDMGEKRVKIPTGWLIEQCGFKGQLIQGIRVHDGNALVLINEAATSYADLAAARDTVAQKVRDTFRINITQEPLELPAAR